MSGSTSFKLNIIYEGQWTLSSVLSTFMRGNELCPPYWVRQVGMFLTLTHHQKWVLPPFYCDSSRYPPNPVTKPLEQSVSPISEPIGPKDLWSYTLHWPFPNLHRSCICLAMILLWKSSARRTYEGDGLIGPLQFWSAKPMGPMEKRQTVEGRCYHQHQGDFLQQMLYHADITLVKSFAIFDAPTPCCGINYQSCRTSCKRSLTPWYCAQLGNAALFNWRCIHTGAGVRASSHYRSFFYLNKPSRHTRH